MRLNKRRIWAIVLRHLYNFRRSYDRIVDAFYWPAIDIILWGLAFSSLKSQGLLDQVYIAMVLFGLILWYVIWRGQTDITVNLLEELWSENLGNIFASPLKLTEWMLALFIVGIIKLFMAILLTGTLAVILYAANILTLGIVLVPFVISLLITSWVIGLFLGGLFLRFGTNIQTLAWSGAVVLMPFSAIFYPLYTLPKWVQAVSSVLPSSYIFEGMRAVLFTGVVPYDMILKSYGLNFVYLILAAGFFIASFHHAHEKGIAHLK